MCTYVSSESTGHRWCSLLMTTLNGYNLSSISSNFSEETVSFEVPTSMRPRPEFPTKVSALACSHCTTMDVNFVYLDFWTTYLQKLYNSTSLFLLLLSEPKKNPSVKRSQVELQQLWWQEAPARHAMGHQSIRRKGLGVLSALSFHSGGALQAEMRKSATDFLILWYDGRETFLCFNINTNAVGKNDYQILK